MASGHANRTNRPNTWLHRPSLRREESPCQLGAVHTWHWAAVPGCLHSRRVEGKGTVIGHHGVITDRAANRTESEGVVPS
jgi:hypothetical protein